MKNLPGLFLFGATATLLSGCYVDRHPTMTLEDRLYADESTLKSLDAVRLRRPTLDEYAATAGVSPHADAFDLKLRSGESYRVYVVLKYRDSQPGGCRVDLLQRSSISDARKDCALIVNHPGVANAALRINLVGATPGSVIDHDSEASLRYINFETHPGSGHYSMEDSGTRGATLPSACGAVRRFVVRHVEFTEAGATRPTWKLEIECLVIPADKPFDADKESAAIQSDILADWKNRS